MTEKRLICVAQVNISYLFTWLFTFVTNITIFRTNSAKPEGMTSASENSVVSNYDESHLYTTFAKLSSHFQRTISFKDEKCYASARRGRYPTKRHVTDLKQRRKYRGLLEKGSENNVMKLLLFNTLQAGRKTTRLLSRRNTRVTTSEGRFFL